MQRVYIMGISGSGKSTLAKTLSQRFQLPRTELDAIHHQPNWTPISDVGFVAALQPILQQDRWVIDGNYSQVTDLILQRADTVILLDYSRPLVMARVLRRTLLRGLLRTELWNGNRESLRNLLSRDPEVNVVMWAWTMHLRRHERNLEVQRRFEGSEIQVHRFEHPRQTRVWLESI